MTSQIAHEGMPVRIKATWPPFYRKAGTATEGVLIWTSPTGSVSRVHLDELGDSYVRTEHLDRARG